jgi:hypothetical protein
MHLSKSLAAAALLLASAATPAATISILPASNDINVGDNLDLELRIDGLGDGTSPSLGAFDIEILFDDAVLGFDSAVYSDLLGTLNADAFPFTTPGPGGVSISNASILDNASLDALQPDAFTLATLTFTGLSAGSRSLSYGTVELYDAFGDPMTPTAQNTSFVTINAVPAPAAALLMRPLLAGLAARHRR